MTSIDSLARDLERLKKDVFKVATQPRLGYSSVDGRAIELRDQAGNVAGYVGTQFDGTVTTAAVGGTTPSSPTVPLVTPMVGGLRIYWDGTYTDGSYTRADFRRVTFHAVTDPEDLDILSPSQIVGEINVATGGEISVMLPYVEHFIYAVTWTDAGKFSYESDPGFGTPAFISADDLSPDFGTDGEPPAVEPVLSGEAGFDLAFLSWTAVDNADPIWYEVAAGSTAGFTPGPEHVLDQVTNTRMIPSITSETFFRVRALDADGATAWSNEVSVTPKSGALRQDLDDAMDQVDQSMGEVDQALLDIDNALTVHREDIDAVDLAAIAAQAAADLAAAEAAAAQAAADLAAAEAQAAFTAAAAAEATADAAQAAADGAIRTFGPEEYPTSPPWPNGSTQPSSYLGDLWLNDQGVAHRWNGTTWYAIPDEAAASALAAANAAQQVADAAASAANAAQLDVNAVEGRVATAEGSLASTITRVTTAEGQISSVDSRVDNAEVAIGAQETRISTAEGTLTTVDGRLDSAESTIGTHSTRLTNAEATIDTVESEVGSVAGNVSSLTTRVTTAEGTVSNHSTRIGVAESTITNHSSRLSGAEADIDSVTTIAQGKSKTTYSTAEPGTTANSAGDTWFRLSGSEVIGVWKGNGGTSWTAEKYGGAILEHLDAGTITVGILAADRIGANTIATGHLAANAVTAAKIQAGSIDTTKIVTAGLDAATIKFGTMSGDRIEAGSIVIGQVAGLDTSLASKETPSGAQAKATAAQNAAIAAAATDATTKANAAKTAAEAAAATDAAAKAEAARLAAIATASGDATDKANAAKAAAEATAAADALTKANTARDAAIAAAAAAAEVAFGPTRTLTNGWKKTGQTTIDGGKIATDSIEAGSIKTGSLTIGPPGAGSPFSYASGYDPSTKETPTGAQAKATAAQNAAVAAAAADATAKANLAKSQAEAAAATYAEAEAEAARLAAIATASGDATSKANAAKAAAEAAAAADALAKANAARDAAILAGKVVSSAGAKSFQTPLTWGQSVNGAPGLLVVDTPITFGNYMAQIRMSGFNYFGNESAMNLDVSFYAYSVGPSFPQISALNGGTTRINSIRLARKVSTGTVSIIIERGGDGLWYYPKLSVDRAVVGQAVPPDSFKDGWSASIKADTTGYDTLTTPTLKQIVEATDLTQGWRTTGQTTINGGKITADSIEAAAIKTGSLTIGPPGGTSPITYAAGYDPSTKETPTGAQTKATAAKNSAVLDSIFYTDLTYGGTKSAVTGWTKTGTTKINGGEIFTDSILAGSIASDAILSRHVKANEILAGHIKAGEIDTEHLKADAITAELIKAGAIEAEHLSVGSVTADAIRTGVLESGHVLTGTLDVEGSIKVGDNEWTKGKGLIFPGAMVLPEDPAQDASLNSHVNAKSLTVEQDLLVQGTNNQIAGAVTLASKVQPPATKPTAFASLWPTSISSLPGPAARIRGAAMKIGDANTVLTLMNSMNDDPTGTRVGLSSIVPINKNTGAAGTPVDIYATVGGPGRFGAGIATMGSDYYVLTWDVSDAWRLWRLNSSFAVVSSRVVTSEVGGNLTSYGQVTLGTYGTTHIVAATPKPNSVGMSVFNLATMTLSSYYEVGNLTGLSSTPIGGVGVANYDFGGQRTVIASQHQGSFVFNGNGSTGDRLGDAYNFHVSGNAQMVGQVWDGTRFLTLDANGNLTKHADNTQSQTVTASYTWYDGTGTVRTTTPSPAVTFTRPPRQWVNVVTPTPPAANRTDADPDKPNRASVYMGIGAGARVLQAHLALGSNNWVNNTVITGTAAEPTTNTFPDMATPGVIASGSGSTSIHGDGRFILEGRRVYAQPILGRHKVPLVDPLVGTINTSAWTAAYNVNGITVPAAARYAQITFHVFARAAANAAGYWRLNWFDVSDWAWIMGLDETRFGNLGDPARSFNTTLTAWVNLSPTDYAVNANCQVQATAEGSAVSLSPGGLVVTFFG